MGNFFLKRRTHFDPELLRAASVHGCKPPPQAAYLSCNRARMVHDRGGLLLFGNRFGQPILFKDRNSSLNGLSLLGTYRQLLRG